MIDPLFRLLQEMPFHQENVVFLLEIHLVEIVGQLFYSNMDETYTSLLLYTFAISQVRLNRSKVTRCDFYMGDSLPPGFF